MPGVRIAGIFVMTSRIAWGWAVALFVGCTGTPLLDTQDDMGANGPSSSPGTIDDVCNCLDESCAWPVTECAAEPDCAGWLTCAKQCPTGTDTWSSSCISGCPEPGTARGQQLRDDLLLCASTAPGCCGESLDERAPDAEADAEPTDWNDVDGGALDATMGGYDPALGPVCPGTSCDACLWAVIANKEGCAAAGPDPTCSETIGSCYHENGYPEQGINHCWRFVTRSDCLNPNAEDLLAGECGYAVPIESEALTDKTLGCAIEYCPVCFPRADAVCFACQLEACPDEFSAFMHDADAQRLQWCFEACEGATEKAACRASCQQSSGDGAEVLSLLLACRKTACEQACAGGTP